MIKRRDSCPQFDGVQIWTATMAREREGMGAQITRWMRDNPDKEIVDYTITQSSDAAYHCVVVTFFYRQA